MLARSNTPVVTENTVRRLFKALAFCVLFLYFSLFFAVKINTANSDLPRHLTNGYNVLFGDREGVLHTDFYSYTNPETPHVNHHYLFGVLLYPVFAQYGYIGVSMVFSLLGATFLFILFVYAYKKLGFVFGLTLLVLFIPILTLRTEVRPEMFTFVFFALQLLLLVEYRHRLKVVHYIVFFVMQAVWVNIHNHAMLALVLPLVFAVEAFITKNKQTLRSMGLVFVVQVVAMFITPFGFGVFLIPFEPFLGMGAKPIENMPLGTYGNKQYGLIVLAVIGLCVGLYSLSLKKFRAYFGLALLVCILAVGSILVRRFYLMFSFTFFILCVNFAVYVPQTYLQALRPKLKLVLPVIMLLALAIPISKGSGYGVKRGVASAGEFYIDNKVEGPLYNDFNTGSYMIYYLSLYQHSPSQGKKVYVHNVPESQPVEFLKRWSHYFTQGEFVPGDQEKFNFNAIVLDTTYDYTPFFARLLTDDEWVLVHYNGHVAVFVKNVEKNARLISNFGYSQDQLDYILREKVNSYYMCEAAKFKVVDDVCETCASMCITPWGKSFKKTAN